jgi:hypothetical protein
MPVYTLPGVELFGSGTYRGQEYSPDHVRLVAANVRRLGGRFVPPGVAQPLTPEGGIGHDEAEDSLDWLERTDVPAAGQVDPQTVRVVPDPANPGHVLLVGDLVNVPEETAAKVRNREYNRGSVELYEDFTDDFGNRHGPAIRRHCLMGGFPPQVKRLAPLPQPVPQPEIKVFAEGGLPRATTRRIILSFAERTTVDDAALKAAIKAAMPQLSDDFLAGLSPDRLAELAKSLPTAPAAPAAAVTPMADGAGMSHDQLVQALTDLGQDPSSLAGMDDAALQGLYSQLTSATTFADDANAVNMDRDSLITALAGAGQDVTTLQGLSDDDLRAMYTQILGSQPAAAAVPAVTPMSEPGRRRPTAPARPMPLVHAAAKKAAQTLAFAERVNRRLAVRENALKLQRVDAFCEEEVRAGRMLPAQVGDYKALLGRLDDVHTVHRFSENGQTRMLSALDLKMAELRKRAPIVRFGEKHKTVAPVGADEEAKVREFAEVHAKAIRQTGKTPEQFVQVFSELRKKKPELTAQAYLGT